MAFQNKNLSVIAYAKGFTLWHYKENATLATITASGYFSSLKNLMNSGDIILINGSNGSTIKVVSISEGVVTVGALS